MNEHFFHRILYLLIFSTGCCFIKAQPVSSPWHGIEREIRYHPEGTDFVIENGKKRFNRALYGSNTVFRAEAGDLPEFALYMPGMGGTIRFGLIANNSSKWLISSENIIARYRPGSMIYEIKDPLLKEGILIITVLPLYTGEGIIVKAEANTIPAGLKLFVAFGGASGTKFSRDGDIGADPESSFYLKPEYCRDNIYRLDKNTFTLQYGFSKALTDEERYEIQHIPGQKNDTGGPPVTRLTPYPLPLQRGLLRAAPRGVPVGRRDRRLCHHRDQIHGRRHGHRRHRCRFHSSCGRRPGVPRGRSAAVRPPPSRFR